MYPFTVYIVFYCFRNHQVEGRQIADPYGFRAASVAIFGFYYRTSVLICQSERNGTVEIILFIL